MYREAPPPDVLCHIANAVEEPKDLLSFESIFRKYHDFESAWFEQCQRHLASFHEVTKALPMLYAPWSDLAPTSILGQFRQKYAPYARTWKECFKMNHHPSHWYTERPDWLWLADYDPDYDWKGIAKASVKQHMPPALPPFFSFMGPHPLSMHLPSDWSTIWLTIIVSTIGVSSPVAFKHLPLRNLTSFAIHLNTTTEIHEDAMHMFVTLDLSRGAQACRIYCQLFQNVSFNGHVDGYPNILEDYTIMFRMSPCVLRDRWMIRFLPAQTLDDQVSFAHVMARIFHRYFDR